MSADPAPVPGNMCGAAAVTRPYCAAWWAVVKTVPPRRQVAIHVAGL